jgi:hypothetical protein
VRVVDTLGTPWAAREIMVRVESIIGLEYHGGIPHAPPTDTQKMPIYQWPEDVPTRADSDDVLCECVRLPSSEFDRLMQALRYPPQRDEASELAAHGGVDRASAL